MLFDTKNDTTCTIGEAYIWAPSFRPPWLRGGYTVFSSSWMVCKVSSQCGHQPCLTLRSPSICSSHSHLRSFVLISGNSSPHFFTWPAPLCLSFSLHVASSKRTSLAFPDHPKLSPYAPSPLGHSLSHYSLFFNLAHSVI